MESPFRIAFWFILGGMVVMQAYYALRVRPAGERTAVDRKPTEREGRAHAVVRTVRSISLAAFLVLKVLGVDPKPRLGATCARLWSGTSK